MYEGLPSPDIVAGAQEGMFRLNYDIKTLSRPKEDCNEKHVSYDENGFTSRRRGGAIKLTRFPAWHQAVRSGSERGR